MKMAATLRYVAISLAWVMCAAASAQRPDPQEALKREVRLLRSQNQQLIKENAELKAQLAALKNGTSTPTTKPAAATRPLALSNVPEPKRVVFILDGSGSMLNVFPSAQTDVLKLIKELKPNQSFAVVFGQEGSNDSLPKSPLIANDQNKQRVTELILKLHPRSGDNFSGSMKAALAMNPDLIWWVGDVPQNWPTDMESLRRVNVKKVRINTIPKNLVSDKEGRTLWFAWTVAKESGGVCLNDKGDVISEQPPEPPPPGAPKQPVKLEIQVN